MDYVTDSVAAWIESSIPQEPFFIRGLFTPSA